MISIGNDIVDLSSVDTERSNNIKFYSKFVTATELALYNLSAKAKMPFESFVWLLWSVKESAYKYLKRHQTSLVFSPAKVVVKQLSIPHTPLSINLNNLIWENTMNGTGFYAGEVIIDEITLSFRSIIQTEFVATIVDLDPEFNKVHWGISVIKNSDYTSQTNSVRTFVLNKLKSVFPKASFTIQKSVAGVPVVMEDDQETNVLLSLSHHNHFISYTFKVG